MTDLGIEFMSIDGTTRWHIRKTSRGVSFSRYDQGDHQPSVRFTLSLHDAHGLLRAFTELMKAEK